LHDLADTVTEQSVPAEPNPSGKSLTRPEPDIGDKGNLYFTPDVWSILDDYRDEILCKETLPCTLALYDALQAVTRVRKMMQQVDYIGSVRGPVFSAECELKDVFNELRGLNPNKTS
jgi:hypothetical protein